MGIRQLPFFKPKKGWQMAGNGLDAGGGGYVLPTASADTLGGVRVGDDLTISNAGVLSAHTIVATVTADGVKTYRELLNELYNALPANYHFEGSLITIDDNILYACKNVSGFGMLFCNSIIDEGIGSYTLIHREVVISSTAANCQFKRTNSNNDYSSTAPSSGAVITIYYN